jgi:hypothetical protein
MFNRRNDPTSSTDKWYKKLGGGIFQLNDMIIPCLNPYLDKS